MATNKEVTGTVVEDGALVIKDGESSIRYVKESDLLAVKGSRKSAEEVAKEVESVRATVLTESKASVDSALQRALQAEARVSSLQEQIDKGVGTAAQVTELERQLATAKTSSEETGNRLLGLRRELIVKSYNVPVATVEKKNLSELDTFEEALKAVIGSGGAGNYAFGGGGGGNQLAGKTPRELAQMAYEGTNKK